MQNNLPLAVENLNYTLELFPGQVFTGSWYYWTDGSPLSAQLQESPEVPWLSISLATFTSDTCTDIINVMFNLTAPANPGIYTTTIVDQNGNWPNDLVTLSVTNTPVSAYSESVQINPGQTYTNYDSIYFTPFTGVGCLPFYIPASSGTVNYSLIPSVSWLTITPSQFIISSTDTTIVEEKFFNNKPGNYSCYEVFTAQYFSWPEFTQWNLDVATGIKDLSNGKTPSQFELYQNFSNPFNPTTTISFSLPRSSQVKMEHCTLLGQRIRTLVNKNYPAGTHQIQFNGENLPSGIYLYRIQAGDFVQTRKLILMK